jgi:hypothetical protein
MFQLRQLTLVLASLILLPSLAFAQATIAGSVRDTSGAVLPGVTVEAASPALIERVRSVTTDASGRYSIVDLRPGTYTVTFTLPGFNAVKREGVQLSGSFVATIDVELVVGALQETITVTGEAPVVDVQSTTRQRVLTSEVIDEIPTSRNHYSLGVLVPGVTTSQQDVGGVAGNQQGETLSIHGSRGDDMRVTQAGLSLGTLVSGGAKSANTYNLGAMQEVAIDTGAVSAEMGQGGIRINLIPKEGGNTFSGSLFTSFANGSMQGSNYSEELQARGLSTPGTIDKNWAVNPNFGGPLRRDKVWFFLSYANNGAANFVPGMFYNRNANNPNVWTYEPDETQPAILRTTWGNAQGRVTWQVNETNKLGVMYDRNFQCQCLGSVAATTAPEAGQMRRYPGMGNTIVDWTSPFTNRVLFESAVIHRSEKIQINPATGVTPNMISVTDQFTGLTYRNRVTTGTTDTWFVYYRAAMSYITGSHAFKVGFNNGVQRLDRLTTADQPTSYTLNSASGVPVPNRITLQAVPHRLIADVSAEGGIFAQDKWTMDRLTLAYGVRYDFVTIQYPEQHLGPSPLVPGRNLTLAAADGISWKDLTPKFGASYDLRGNGRTAVKMTANKYVAGQGLSGPFGADLNPVSRLVQTTTRNWTDTDRDFVPDCDLANPAANGECAAMANRDFGGSRPGSAYDPETLTGWGKRPYDWEFSAGVQHQLVTGVSVSVDWFRRSFGNFVVTDNRALTAEDFDAFTITAPVDQRLPGGGGYVVSGLYNLDPAKFGVPADNYLTFADNFGNQTSRWNGLDLGVVFRPRNGLLLQGGTSTGKTTNDSCEIRAALPESTPLDPWCRTESPWLTQVKALASYTVPRADMQVSATFQSIPGGQVVGNFVAANALVQPSLGRPLSGGAANVTVNIVEPWSMAGERLNQLDMRVGKIVRFGRTRSTLHVDLFNVLNANTVLTENPSFGTFRRPATVLPARFAKIGMQIEF